MDQTETSCRPTSGCCGHDVKFDGATPAYRRVLVAVIAYSFMSIRQVKYWAFYFPELLLVLLAFIILIGRYTGYRLSELIRFRDFKEA